MTYKQLINSIKLSLRAMETRGQKITSIKLNSESTGLIIEKLNSINAFPAMPKVTRVEKLLGHNVTMEEGAYFIILTE